MPPLWLLLQFLLFFSLMMSCLNNLEKLTQKFKYGSQLQLQFQLRPCFWSNRSLENDSSKLISLSYILKTHIRNITIFVRSVRTIQRQLGQKLQISLFCYVVPIKEYDTKFIYQPSALNHQYGNSSKLFCARTSKTFKFSQMVSEEKKRKLPNIN